MSHSAIHVLIPHLLPAEYFAIGAAPLEPPSDTVSTIWSFEWHCAKSCHDICFLTVALSYNRMMEIPTFSEFMYPKYIL